MNAKKHETTVAVAPFPFVCTLCNKHTDVGVILDKGEGQLDLTCPACASRYLYLKNYVKPSGWAA
jgi:transcription elongation factor Elf1